MITYNVRFDTGPLTGLVNDLRGRVADFRVPLKRAGVYMHGSVNRNFKAQGRPKKWKKLSTRTLRERRRGRGIGKPQILMDTGILRASVVSSTGQGSVYRLSSAKLILGTNIEYAWSHQLGDAERRIPPRPFLIIHPEDVEAISEIFLDYLDGTTR